MRACGKVPLLYNCRCRATHAPSLQDQVLRSRSRDKRTRGGGRQEADERRGRIERRVRLAAEERTAVAVRFLEGEELLESVLPQRRERVEAEIETTEAPKPARALRQGQRPRAPSRATHLRCTPLAPVRCRVATASGLLVAQDLHLTPASTDESRTRRHLKSRRALRRSWPCFRLHEMPTSCMGNGHCLVLAE
jgi:hypothetical protein